MYNLSKIELPCCYNCIYGQNFGENNYGRCWHETPKDNSPYPEVHKDHFCSNGTFLTVSEKIMCYSTEDYYEFSRKYKTPDHIIREEQRKEMEKNKNEDSK